jgi:predicted Zn finger-like uncharacterized protein
VSTIIECPACSTRYKMNKAIPEGGRSVKCARCAHQWRLLPDEPEELTDTLEFEGDPAESDAPAEAEAANPAPAAEESVSWEARRGNLAAAIASMSEPQGGEDQQDAARDESFAQAREWVSQAPRYEAFASHQNETAAEEPDADSAEGDPAADMAGSSTWPGGDWPGGGAAADSGAQEADADADDHDPEVSVRQALKDAMDDQETEGDEDTFGLRPAFSGARYPGARTAGGEMDGIGQTGEEKPARDLEDDLIGVAKIAFSAREGHFPPAGTISLKNTAEQAAAGAPEDTEQFESDIAGIFSRQPETKRSFGLAAAGRRPEGNFTDYDGGASEQGDDRYMADSPLDADAAALQAALEGSLREKHADEGRGGGGGGLALAAAWAVFLSVLSGVTLAFVNFREEIVEALPGTAALYRGVGFSVQDRMVDFGPVTYRWTVAEGKPMIEVTGQIINLTDHEIAVPRVLVQVHDKENTDTVKASATVRSEPLAARETADFTLEFLAPPKTISQIELAFADTE